MMNIRIAHLPWAYSFSECQEDIYRHRAYEPTCLTIVNDPDDIAGFRRGAIITRYEAVMMLLSCCFTPGTQISYPGHGDMVIVTYKLNKRKIQALKGDNYYLLPNQSSASKRFIRVGQHGQKQNEP